MLTTAADVIAHFGLLPLPGEGGFFTRKWTSPRTDTAGRPAGSAIYFLLTADAFSALHRLQTDELWHFYAGCSVDHVQLTHAGLQQTRLGANFFVGEVPLLVVPAGVWQGARLAPSPSIEPAHAWALLGCTLAPGWDQTELELGCRDPLCREFPSCAEAIPSLVREGASDGKRA